MNRFYIENLGCAKNQVDAEEMIQALEQKGLVFSDNPDTADLIIVNTCGFIGPAKEESIDTLLGYRRVYPHKKIILSGCLAQRYRQEMELPEADAVFGNRQPSRITSVVEAVFRGERPVTIPEGAYSPGQRDRLLGFKGSAYLKIAEGCNNNCSFCAIPLIRGPVASRGIDEVAREFSSLVSRGVREINLIAQDLASYGTDRTSSGELVSLLRRLSSVQGNFSIRLLYIHPDRFPRDLLSVMKDEPRIVPYFDLPFQHAAPGILSSMGRRPDYEKNLALVEEIRQAFPLSAVRTTFLLGYPGETEDDLRTLMDFQARGRFEWLGCFLYSREEGTRASGLASGRQLAGIAKRAARYKGLIEEAQLQITGERLERFAGTDMSLLVEESVEGEDGEDFYICRGYPHAPDVDGAVVLHGRNLCEGDVVPARILRINGFDMEAVPLY
ncbi:MAG: 30S ribosomal protein S12 methylthiotransferase RimO [Spirochaetales bacterium]|nr:30S ribosomal protein S12 methylthiotransferase RimO [Spirochaetales bacterium]